MTNEVEEGRHYRAKADWTDRQKQVLDLLARGYTNREIAEHLGISLDGAKYHVSEIITRAGVDTREEAADYWRQRNGMRGRLRFALERMPGFAALRWTALAVAGGGAAFAVAIAAVAVLNDDSEPPAAASSPTPDTTATTTPAPSATPSPDPDGEGTVVNLTAAEPAPLPGAILYYTVNLPSDAPSSYDRAYVDGNGELVEETMKLNIQVAVDGEVTAILGMRVAPGGQRIVARACGSNCFVGVGEINPDASVWWLESLDGGVTWRELGGRFDSLAPDAAVGFAGFASDGQLLAHQNEGPLWAHPSRHPATARSR